jgi:deazaflavin-dependent oxidoreductase (nitroreductase family)
MSAQHNSLEDRLSRANEINISVTGRKSGRTISNPIWFVFDDGKLFLLPVKGSDTQWYKNVLQNPKIRIKAGSSETELNVTPVTEAKTVSSVVDKFRDKYGPGDVKKFYSKFDAAVIAPIL